MRSLGLLTELDRDLFRHTLQEWCQVLRDSSTGMGDPLRDEAIAAVRGYMKRRLAAWGEEDEWDRLVRLLCEHSLREYHGDGGALRNTAESTIAQRLQTVEALSEQPAPTEPTR